VLPRRCRSLRVGCSLRAVAAHSIAVLVKRSHFAVGLFLGCVVFLQVAWLTTVKSPVQYSLEFRLRLKISEPYLAGRPQPASSSHGLSLPTAHTGSEGPLHAGMPARFGPPSGFGYPLDGLRPSESSATLLATRRCRRMTSSRNSLPVQSFEPVVVSSLWVRRSHFAVGLFLGCVVFQLRAAPAGLTVGTSSLRASRSSRVLPNVA
jgi:hypothetical protein